MILASRHLLDINFPMPQNCVIRINMAWEPSLEILCQQIENIKQDIFIDIPTLRKKPPNYNWSLDQLLFVFNTYKQIKYCAISNVNCVEDIMYALWKLPKHISIVPKIESIDGINNIIEIIDNLRSPKIIMIDHDDLYTDILKNGLNGQEMYTKYINPLKMRCKELGVECLKTTGIIFSNE